MSMALDKHLKSDFFEGTEKLLEMWFNTVEGKDLNLRVIQRHQFEDVLSCVNCDIISTISNDVMDAYLLSESSMFVTKDRLILKTCGKTTLLKCVDKFIRLAKETVGYMDVCDIFYSRKNFSRPDLQIGVHQSFENEVRELDKVFSNGCAYTLGRINADCWHLYTLEHEGVTCPDQTFELLMWDMCPEKMAVFTEAISENGRDATVKSGIIDLLPATTIDDYLFSPYGYSMNGLLFDDKYITIHVTPQPECSYVSFESNIPQASYHSLIAKVLKVFNPKTFLMTIFANRASVACDVHRTTENLDHIMDYRQREHQVCLLNSYHLTYTQFSKSSAIPH